MANAEVKILMRTLPGLSTGLMVLRLALMLGLVSQEQAVDIAHRWARSRLRYWDGSAWRRV